MSRRLYILAGILTLVAALGLTDAFAGSTGKISGQVVDEKGEPLPGANVVIKGSRQGATADAEGHYVILAVDPGTYELVASLIGYNTVTNQGVQVSVDATTPLDFDLQERTIEAEEIVVQAKAPPVERDKTSTKYTVSADEIRQAPIIRTTAEFISLLPGVDMGGTFSVRGSDYARAVQPVIWATSGYNSADVYVIIDGVRVPRGDGNSAGLFTGVNKSAVQQMSVETGVAPAEYGDAKAGSISIVTRDGGKEYHGWTEITYEPAGKKHWGANIYDAPAHKDNMKWDDPEWVREIDPQTGRVIHARENYTGYHGAVLEGSLMGPIGSKASFMVSQKHERRAPVYPDAENHGFYSDSQRGRFINAPGNIQGSGNITFRPSQNTKLKVGLVLQHFTAYNGEVNNRNYGAQGFIRSNRSSRAGLRNLFLPKQWSAGGRYKFQEDLEYLAFTHIVSPRTFYEIRIARSQTSQDTIDAPAFTTQPRLDQDRWFYIDRNVAMWIDSRRTRWSVKGDLSSQITKGNLMKTGFEVIRWDARFVQYGSRSATDHWVSFYSGGDEPWRNGSPASPIRGAVYVQDKMEFEGIVVNAGVRLDFEKTTHEELISAPWLGMPMWYWYTTRGLAYGEGSVPTGFEASGKFAQTPPWRFHLSPRLGISHPITDRMAMHYSIGQFVQWIDLFQMYAKAYRNYGLLGTDGDPNWQDLNKNGVRDPAEEWTNMRPNASGIAGDPHEARAEKSLTFEVGVDWNFVSDYAASMTVFYRSDTNQYSSDGSSMIIAGGRGGSIRGAANSYLQWNKGLEMALGKRMSNYFSFRLAWYMQWGTRGWAGRQNSSRWEYPDSNFVASAEYWRFTDVASDGSRVPVVMTQSDIEKIGRSQENVARSFERRYANDDLWFFGQMPEVQDLDVTAYRRMNSRGGVRYGPMRNYGAVGASRTSQANLQFVVNTPPDVKFGPSFLSWLVSDLNANLLWRLRSGSRVNWTPPGSPNRRTDRGPVDASTDFSMEKTFNSGGRVRPSFFIEIRNVFNDKSDTGGGQNYMRWGLQMAPPDNSDFINYGDFGDRSYFRAPRRTNLGFRVVF